MKKLLIISILSISSSICASEKNEGAIGSKHLDGLTIDAKNCEANENVAKAYKIIEESLFGGQVQYANFKKLLDPVSATELNCNPEIYKENKSLLAAVVKFRITWKIVEFLLKKGADPLDNHQLSFENLYFKNSDSSEDYQKKTENPLWLAYELKDRPWKNTNNRQPNDESNDQKIWNLVSEAAFKKYEKELEAYCQKIFKSLFGEIQKAHAEAVKAKKRLMILVGEGHGDVGSLLCQLMAYQIAYKSLKINTVLEEMDHKMLESYQKSGYTPTRRDKWTTVVEFLNTISESNPRIIPIDINQHTYGGSAVNDPNDVKERNDTMAKESHKVKEDVLCIVGEAHLEGLLNDTDLIENFHVLPIATIDNKRRNTQKEIKDFTEVKKYEMFFSPKIIKHMYSKFPGWIEGLKANKHS